MVGDTPPCIQTLIDSRARVVRIVADIDFSHHVFTVVKADDTGEAIVVGAFDRLVVTIAKVHLVAFAKYDIKLVIVSDSFMTSSESRPNVMLTSPPVRSMASMLLIGSTMSS